MNEFFDRQVAVMRGLISEYREGRLDLNSLIQRIEGVSNAIGVTSWKDAVFPILLAMEQVNAFALDAKMPLTEEDKAEIEKSLRDLQALMEGFEVS